MRYLSVLVVILFLFNCDQPTRNEHNYYNDLSKGSIDCLSLNEKQILNTAVASRMWNRDDIVLVRDSTIIGKFDTTRIDNSDTFPRALQEKYNSINTHKSYIGNMILGISSDYRFFDDVHLDSVFTDDNMGEWNRYFLLYPKSKSGMFSFSKIAFTTDSTQAILKLQSVYGNLGADGGFMSLKKINGVWTILVYRMLWIS